MEFGKRNIERRAAPAARSPMHTQAAPDGGPASPRSRLWDGLPEAEPEAPGALGWATGLCLGFAPLAAVWAYLPHGKGLGAGDKATQVVVLVGMALLGSWLADSFFRRFYPGWQWRRDSGGCGGAGSADIGGGWGGGCSDGGDGGGCGGD